MAEKSGHPRLIVGISGASGAIYGARLLELLRPLPVETHLVISRAAEVTLALETDLKPAIVRSRADLLRLVQDDRHGGRSVFDPQHGRDCQRGNDNAIEPRGGRRAQGTPPPRPHGA